MVLPINHISSGFLKPLREKRPKNSTPRCNNFLLPVLFYFIFFTVTTFVKKLFIMKLLIIGATGGTGTQVVQQALQQGITVTAFVRRPGKLKITHTNLKVVQGNVLQQSSINKIIVGHDAVICCLGAPATKAGNLRSAGTKNIINAMQQNEVSRLICQTSLGFGDSEIVLRNTPWFFKKIIVPYLLKSTFADHLLQENFIQQSKLNWTIVRPGTMTNGKFTGNYQHGFSYSDEKLKVKISRADVADFLIQQVSSTQYQKKVTGISY
jgi:putative NADH-flavin reductase